MVFVARRRDRPSEAQVSPRAMWYDRNSTFIRKTWNGLVGPHAAVTRWTYTVPTGKKTFIGLMSLTMLRETAATTAGEALCYIRIQTQIVLCIGLFNAAVDTNRTVAASGEALLNASETIDGQTYDSSTGGTISYTSALLLTEFDV